MGKIWIKTQTNKSTKFKENILNVNSGIRFNGHCFEFGICSVKYWGDYEHRDIPLITLEIEGTSYELPLTEFIKKIKPLLVSIENTNKKETFIKKEVLKKIGL